MCKAGYCLNFNFNVYMLLAALQLSAPRADNPVELELVAVESGPKRDMFDAALQTCHNVL